MLTWGILGAGSVAQRRVIPSMHALASCEVGALMVRDQGRADALVAELDVPRAYSSVEDLLADDKLDAIYVSSPVSLHEEHAIAVAKAGKHVLCEKPMALTPDACRRIIRVCGEEDVHLQLCFVLRGWPIYQRLKTMVEDGTVGQFVSARAHLAKWVPWDDDSWRRDVAQSGGGVLVDVGTHYLDLFRFLFGEIFEVVHRGGSPVLDIEVEETSHALVSFENGGHGQITSTIVVPHNGNVLEIYGTKGSIFLGSTLRVVTEEGEQLEEVVFPDYFSGLLDQFVTCVEKGEEPLASGLDGLRNIELVTQAYASEDARVELADGTVGHLRWKRPSDGPGIGRMLESCSEQTALYFYPYPLTTESGHKVAQDESIRCHVLEVGEEVVGYVWLQSILSEIPTLGICVADAWQGKGVGRALMEASIEAARTVGKPALRLTVNQDNDRAFRLYESLGFETTGPVESKRPSYEMRLKLE